MSQQRPAAAPHGEQDLLLKVAMSQIFWGMTCATRLNVKMSFPGQRSTPEELSDLDCVGISVGPDFSVRILVADCKSGKKVSPATRAFWLAGVREFMRASRGYLVLERTVPRGVRELASRLSLDVLGQDDLAILLNVHGSNAVTPNHLNVATVERARMLGSNLDKKLASLVEFKEYTYWTLPQDRRAQRSIVELRKVAPLLDSARLEHRVLVLEGLFLFALAMLEGCRYVSAVSLSDPGEALLEYHVGGPAAKRERGTQLSSLEKSIDRLSKSVQVPKELRGKFQLEPAYFDDLAETVVRLLRRPHDAARVLRYIEWWTYAQEVAGLESLASQVEAYAGYSRKLVSDLARTYFTGGGLTGGWLTMAKSAGAPLGDNGEDGASARAPGKAQGNQLKLDADAPPRPTT
ncbi:MAG: hypothetical protein M3198_18435 [Actinomycetota bacterium]|nr:hypothetical protein [Actinomycetota bacterium]